MLKNIFANFIGRFWSIISNFLFIPIYIKILGFENYSIISFSLVVTGIMAILDSGLTASLSREFSRSDNTRLDKVKIFKTLESCYVLIILIIVVSLNLLSNFIANNWLNIDELDPEDISLSLKIISFDIGFQLLFRFYTGGFLGLEKQVKSNIFQIIWGILRNGLVIIIIWIIPSLIVFFVWQAGSTMFISLLLGFFLKKELFIKYRLSFIPFFEPEIFQKIWRFAGGMFLISLVGAVNTQLDKLVISKFLPIESLGYYTLAVSLSMGIVVLVNPISIALLPRFTSLYSAGRVIEANLLFRRVNLYVSILVFSIFSNLSFFAQDIIFIWTGNLELAEKSSLYVPFVSLSATMLSVATIPYNIAIANGYTKLNNVLGVLSLIITIPGYWVATYLYGAIGAALIYCSVQTVVTLIYIFKINSKFLNEKNLITIYFHQILAPFSFSLLISFVFSNVPEIFLNSMIGTIGWICISIIITVLVLTLILAPKEQFVWFVNFVKSKIYINNIK